MVNNKVLVTGGAGHIGSHLVELLVANPSNHVISLDNYFNGSENNHVQGVEYLHGHTKDIESLLLETPDLIYHLGEYARIAPSVDETSLVYDLNIIGTFEVVEYCRKHKVKKLVYAASSTRFAIEGNGRHQNPYSFTKSVNVDLINDYGKWFGLPYVICYFYNAFGPREKGESKYATVIAKYEQLYLQGLPLPVVKPGTQKRAFTYVKDLARGIMMAGEKGLGDGYALGAKRSHSIIEIAEAFGGPVELVEGYPGRDESVNDINKAREELNWDTTVDIMEYISDYVKEHPR